MNRIVIAIALILSTTTQLTTAAGLRATNVSNLPPQDDATEDLFYNDDIEFYKDMVHNGHITKKDWLEALFDSAINDDDDDYDDDDNDLESSNSTTDPREKDTTTGEFIGKAPRYLRAR